MKHVRIGIIGMGNMGKFHAKYLLDQKVKRCELTAVCDPVAAMLEPFKSLKTFTDPDEFMKSGLVDAVIIATPHFQHTSLGIVALKQGLHLMVEKPISVHKADGERLLAAHTNPDQVFAALFQLRTEPRYLKIKSLLDRNELGRITRVNWIISDWYRTEAYYSSGGWRATWRGEGGGVLLNQCPHNLDMLLWLCGRPSRVRGFCQLGRFHNIEVEDNVTVYLEWANGATGVFITSTGETPGTNRFEIVGEQGKLVLEQDTLRFTRNEVSMLEFSKTSKAGFAKPPLWNVEIPFESHTAQHHAVTQNFVDAILDGTPLIAPGADGLQSIELANAALFSSLENRPVDLPLDAVAYEKCLEKLIAESKFEKKVVATSQEDFSKSFNR